MPDISKIKTPDGSVYDIKDDEVRHILDILLGIEKDISKDHVNTQ